LIISSKSKQELIFRRKSWKTLYTRLWNQGLHNAE